MKKLFYCIVLGGGPAGLSTAIYLTRYNRDTLVIDRETGGRWHTHEINENYLGFPDGISSEELRERGKRQAERFGTVFRQDTILSVKKNADHFLVTTEKESYLGKTIVVATGVTDQFSKLELINSCLGKSIFWCITCDGHKTIGKKIVVTGESDETISTALQFLNFTHDIALLLPEEFKTKKDHLLKTCQEKQIKLHYGTLENIKGENGYISQIITSTGESLKTDFLFYMREALPNTSFLIGMPLKTSKKGYLLIDREQRTNVSGVYAAGDITKDYAHQIVSAAHEGATAGQAVNYDLYEPYQKEDF